MNEFKGTPGPWILAHSTVIGRGMNSICSMLGCVDMPVPKANAALIAAAPELLQALQMMLDDECPLTGNPTRERLIEHWQYELEQGNGYAENALFALRTVAKALGEKP